MKSTLIETLWLSEKRKKLLLLLIEGPRDIEQIKKSLNVTSRAMMPQIKILKDKDLIFEENGVYRLSNIGEIIVKNMNPLMNTLMVIEENKEYWANRDLNHLPSDLFRRLGELGHYFIVEPDLNHMFELPIEFSANIKNSKHVMTCASYFHPAYPKLYSELAEKGIEMTLVLTSSIFNRMQKDSPAELENIISKDNTRLFVYDGEIDIPTVTVTDWFTYICFFDIEGRYDHKQIMSFDENALQWSKELFQYYMDLSKTVESI